MSTLRNKNKKIIHLSKSLSVKGALFAIGLAGGLIPFTMSNAIAYGQYGQGGGKDRGKGAGINNILKPKSTKGPTFPPYPSRPSQGVPQVQNHSDHFGNRVTEDHLNRVQFAAQRSTDVMKTDAHVNHEVAFHGAAYTGTLHPVFREKSTRYNDHYMHYNQFISTHPMVWDTWHRHYFYGGFFYAFHPVPDIHIYFHNPLIHWFFVGTWDESFYQTWYGPEYSTYPELNKPFQFYGVYYPTENLRQLLQGVSAMSMERQANFRLGISAVTQKIAQQMANATHQRVALSQGDIVVTHYEVLGYDDGIVLEGFANNSALGQPSNFKAFVDLHQATGNQLFLAASPEVAPTAAQLSDLDTLNASISRLNGAAMPAPAPPAPEAPASAEAVANPN